MSSKTSEFGRTTMSAELMKPCWLCALFNCHDPAYVRLANKTSGTHFKEYERATVWCSARREFFFRLKGFKTTLDPTVAYLAGACNSERRLQDSQIVFSEIVKLKGYLRVSFNQRYTS